MRRAQAGFTFIEVLIVMGIIMTLMAVMVGLVPMVQERGRRTQSIAHVRDLATMLVTRAQQKSWPPYDGKNFVLSLVATKEIRTANPDRLRMLFSPGDRYYEFDKLVDISEYDQITAARLRDGEDFRRLTSYAGRRNATKEWLISPQREDEVVPIVCDDDDGPCHHSAGLVMGFTNGAVSFREWKELGMEEPADLNNPEPFLGVDATSEVLMGLSSQ